MAITINRVQFGEAFNRAAAFRSARSPKPVLQNVLLKPNPGKGIATGAQLVATDLECGIITDAGVIGEPFNPMLLSERFGAILRASGDEELTITQTDRDTIVVAGERSNFTLPTEDPSNFPDPGAPKSGDGWSIFSRDFRRLIRQTSFATDCESTRYALGGCLVEADDKEFALVGTDGRRLGRSAASFVAEGSPTPPKSCVVPVRTLRLVDRLLDTEGPVIVSTDGSHVWFRTDNGYVWSNLVEGRFPWYQDVFPKQKGERARCSADELTAALQQGSIVCSEESRWLDCTFSPGYLELRGQSADIGSSKITLPIDYDGREVVVTFDPRYLVDALKTVEGEVAIEIIDSKNAVQMHADGFRYVVMPLTRDDASAKGVAA